MARRKNKQFGLALPGGGVVKGVEAVALVGVSVYVLRALQLAFHMIKNGNGPSMAASRGIAAVDANHLLPWFKFFLSSPRSNWSGIEGKAT